jgi:hypothetical protein
MDILHILDFAMTVSASHTKLRFPSSALGAGSFVIPNGAKASSDFPD